MGKARVYHAIFDGKERMVEANSAGQAKHHIAKVETAKVRERIGDVHPASSISVSTFVRGGGVIETAGVMPEPPKDGAERARELLGAGEAEAETKGGEDGADA